MSLSYKLPAWVATEPRGFFRDDVIRKLGSKHTSCTSWLSSWKPKDENSKIHFSYIKKNEDEIVAKSKSFLIAEFQPTKKKCVICDKKFINPSWVCFTYKFKEGITKDKINDSRHLACIYHFECKGIFNQRKLENENEYDETDDFNESEFEEIYNEFEESDLQIKF